jgi:hypothetical protein
MWIFGQRDPRGTRIAVVAECLPQQPDAMGGLVYGKPLAQALVIVFDEIAQRDHRPQIVVGHGKRAPAGAFEFGDHGGGLGTVRPRAVP